MITFFQFSTQVQSEGVDLEVQEESNIEMILQAKHAILQIFEELEAEAR